MSTVEVPDELLALLKDSRLAEHPLAEQVRTAIVIHLLQHRVITVGRAAELCEMPRQAFEAFLMEIGVPSLRYDLKDLEDDIEAARRADQA
jgi:predicted HTH domain antitoxin